MAAHVIVTFILFILIKHFPSLCFTRQQIKCDRERHVRFYPASEIVLQLFVSICIHVLRTTTCFYLYFQKSNGVTSTGTAFRIPVSITGYQSVFKYLYIVWWKGTDAAERNRLQLTDTSQFLLLLREDFVPEAFWNGVRNKPSIQAHQLSINVKWFQQKNAGAFTSVVLASDVSDRLANCLLIVFSDAQAGSAVLLRDSFSSDFCNEFI